MATWTMPSAGDFLAVIVAIATGGFTMGATKQKLNSVHDRIDDLEDHKLPERIMTLETKADRAAEVEKSVQEIRDRTIRMEEGIKHISSTMSDIKTAMAQSSHPRS